MQFGLAAFQDRDVLYCVSNRNPDRDTCFSFVSSKVDLPVALLYMGISWQVQ